MREPENLPSTPSARAVPPPNARAEIEHIVSQFETAWREGGRPDVARYVPAAGPSRLDLLRELARADLEFRLKLREPADPAEYLERFPELKADPDILKSLTSARDRVLKGTEERTMSYSPASEPGDGVLRESDPQVPAAVAPQTIAPGVEFGRYKVEKLLGRGGMGAVYLAHDSQLGRPVALKVPHLTGKEAGDVTGRLLREAKAAAILSHPNICRVYDAGVEAGTYFIAMEFIEGRPLSDFIAPSHLQDERRIVIVVRKLALALAEAHAKGIIHRDLKPGNVLVNARGEPILTDFGLARLSDQMHDGVSTETGMLVGSPAYMSPEQARGEPEGVGRSSDIYSLGVVLFEMLTGRRPFQGSLLSVLAQIAAEEPPSPATLRPGLDPRIDALCRRMTAKRPQDRHASMADVAQELTTWLKSAPAISPAAPLAAMQQAPRPADDAAVQSLQLLPEGIAAARAAAPAPPVGPSASEVAQLRRRVEKLLKEQDFGAALPLLAKLADLSGTISKELAAWAKSQLAATKEKQRELRERMTAACKKARAALARHGYSEALGFLEEFPDEVRSDEARELFSHAADSLEEYLGLQEQIERALKRKNYDSLLPLVKRFLKFKPDNLKMERLAEHLERNSPARAIANYKGTEKYYDVAGRLVEPKQMLGVGLGIAVLCAVGLFVGVKLLGPGSGDNRESSRPGSTAGDAPISELRDMSILSNAPQDARIDQTAVGMPEDLQTNLSNSPQDGRMDHHISLGGVIVFVSSSRRLAPAPPKHEFPPMPRSLVKWAEGDKCMPKLDCQPISKGKNFPWDNLGLPFMVAVAYDNDLHIGRAMVKPSNVIELTRAAEYYTLFTQNDNLRGWAYCCLGIVRHESGDLKNAAADYTRAIGFGYGRSNAAAYINRATIREQDDDYILAQQDFDEALTLQPQWAILHYNLAHCLYSKGDRFEALKHYEKAVEIDPDDPLSLNNRALIYFEKGQSPEALADKESAATALADLDSAIKKDPRFVVASANKAAILDSMGRDDEALAAYTDLIRQDHSKRYRDYAHLRREQLLTDKMGLPENSQRDYESALKREPGYQYARFRLVEILEARGESARAFVERNAMTQKIYVSACVRHAELLNLMGDPGKALITLDTCLKLYDGDTELLRARSALLSEKPSQNTTEKTKSN